MLFATLVSLQIHQIAPFSSQLSQLCKLSELLESHRFSRVFAIEFLKLAQDFFGLFRENSRKGYLYLDELVTAKARVSEAREAAFA